MAARTVRTVDKDGRLHGGPIVATREKALLSAVFASGMTNPGSSEMTLGTVLLIVLVLALLGVIPTWPHSKGWGYGPSGGVGLLVVILVVLLVTGNI